MKVNWLVDGYLLDSASNVGDLVQAIKDSGHNLHLTKYIPLGESYDQDYGPDHWLNEPTILYGQIGYIKKCNKPFIPGAYGFNNNTDCNVYYTKIPSEWMLNADFFMLPFGIIKNNIQRIFSMVDDNKFFLRPNSGRKTFAGLVINDSNYEHEFNSSQQITSVTDETICVVAPVKKLQGEFRFAVIGGEVIDGSEYRWDNILDIRRDYPQECWELANKMAKHSWIPDAGFTVDVALTENGPKIIELNSLASSGLYAIDRNIFVEKVSEYALKEFNGLV